MIDLAARRLDKPGLAALLQRLASPSLSSRREDVIRAASPTGFEADDENAPIAEDLAAEATDPEIESPQLDTVRDQSAIFATGGGAVSDVELERAIVAAVTGGALDVARVLGERLAERQRGAGNVVDLSRERERRR